VGRLSERRWRRATARAMLSLLFLSCAINALEQTTPRRSAGGVRDGSGGVLPGATVTSVHPASGTCPSSPKPVAVSRSSWRCIRHSDEGADSRNPGETRQQCL